MNDVLRLSESWHEVRQHANRLVLFAGRLPHFRSPILPSVKASGPRACVLANLWHEKKVRLEPYHNPALLTPSEFRSFLKLRAGDGKKVKELAQRYAEADIRSIFKIVRRRYA